MESENPTVNFLQFASKELELFLVGGSIPIKRDSKIYNTTLIYDNGEFLDYYDKLHTFDIDIPGKMTIKESDSI